MYFTSTTLFTTTSIIKSNQITTVWSMVVGDETEKGGLKFFKISARRSIDRVINNVEVSTELSSVGGGRQAKL